MESDMEMSLDFSWETPSFFELCDADSMHLPAEDSLSCLYEHGDSTSSPDGANSGLTRRWAGRNMLNERDRRRRLNEKLYAIRGVVPNITKEVMQVVEDLAVVNVRHRKAQEAMAKVYGVLESLCLNVITASVTVVSDNIVHNMFIETDGMDCAQTIKEMVKSHSVISM
ncbi:unnamed protein product [Triticum turgidum subsp. durum]|uniref:Transcription factor n=1 Tax=Triticum turgidum subsp. durum TaxID=4567 RepID=A0A9R0WW74_TRITD|nr:unnamed protein product [Triticum turgidum subsp. durum]